MSCHHIATAWYFIYFWLRWVFVAACGLFSSCGEQRLLSNCSVWASHCSDFSCCGAQALEHNRLSSCGARALEHNRLSSCGARALVTPWHVGFFQTRNWTRVLCIGRQILYCRATREVMLANLFQESSGTWLVMLAHQSMLWGLDSSFSSWIWGDFLEYRALRASKGSASGKEPTCQCRRCRFSPWVGKIPWRRKWQPTPMFLPGEFHGQRSLVGYSPWGHKESDTTEAT